MSIVKVEILTDNHKHEDKPVAKGDVIELPEDVAKIFVDAKIAKPKGA